MATNFDAMTEAELEAHIQGLSERRAEMLAEIKAEQLEATRAMDAKLTARREEEARRAMEARLRGGPTPIEARPEGIATTVKMAGDAAGDGE